MPPEPIAEDSEVAQEKIAPQVKEVVDEKATEQDIASTVIKKAVPEPKAHNHAPKNLAREMANETKQTETLEHKEEAQKPTPSSPLLTEGEEVEQHNLNQPNSDTEPDELQNWIATLQYRINQFKRYPFQAKRRKLQGEVKMKATIKPDGTLQEATFVSGKQVFYVSSMKAIEQSLPLPPPGNESVTVVFSIHYRLL